MINNSVRKNLIDIKSFKEIATRHIIPIFDYEHNRIGSLYPIYKSLASDSEIVQKLTKWRNLFMRYFLTQFKADETRTMHWLENIIIPSENRILFLILDEHEKPIGNFGASNISEKFAELDNLIRGEKGGHPKLIFFAELSMLNWLFCSCNLDTINLHVFSSNIKTINLHLSVGFESVGLSPLYKSTINSEMHYSLYPSEEKASFEYMEMKLSRKTFESLHHKYINLTKDTI